MRGFPVIMGGTIVAFGQFYIVLFALDGDEWAVKASAAFAFVLFSACWIYAAFFSPDMKVFGL